MTTEKLPPFFPTALGIYTAILASLSTASVLSSLIHGDHRRTIFFIIFWLLYFEILERKNWARITLGLLTFPLGLILLLSPSVRKYCSLHIDLPTALENYTIIFGSISLIVVFLFVFLLNSENAAREFFLVTCWLLYFQIIERKNWARITLGLLTFPLGLILLLSSGVKEYCLERTS